MLPISIPVLTVMVLQLAQLGSNRTLPLGHRLRGLDNRAWGGVHAVKKGSLHIWKPFVAAAVATAVVGAYQYYLTMPSTDASSGAVAVVMVGPCSSKTLS